MKTKKILLLSQDKRISEIIRISALTLTKLNCQVTVDEFSESKDMLSKSREANTDMIIIDSDHIREDIPETISEIRAVKDSRNKKIILIHSHEIDKEKLFSAGCDSIMNKNEFERAVNNILTI